MSPRRKPHPAITYFTTLALACGCWIASPALAVEVRVVDRDGNPVPNVAVYVESRSGPVQPETSAAAVMDQFDFRFVPHILIVERGAAVEFPNSDDVAHHVYSFSRPNQFQLPLYKGDPHEPVRFEHEGVVVLGCNIHDGMLGYILVVDSKVFGKTGTDGSVHLDVSDASGAIVRIWSPRLTDEGDALERSLDAPDDIVTFTLSGRLRAAHGEPGEGLAWNDY